MNNRTKGFIYGAIAAASYGMNPLFTLPLYAAGMSVDSVLFYRYLLAAIVLAILMKIQHQPFAIKKNDIPPLLIMGFLFSFSSLFLFISYKHMRSEEHTSELQSRQYLVCRLLLEKKKKHKERNSIRRNYRN